MLKKKVRKEYSEKDKTKIALIKLLVKILSIIAIVFILLHFVFGIFVCHDNNMFQKVGDGDLIITLKVEKSYSGDIIAYRQDGKVHFGRVVAVDGDTVNITDTNYTINGTNPYEVIYYKTLPNGDKVKYPLELSEGKYFVLNDMREDMNDSRTFGTIDKKDYLGKVVLLLRRRGF